MLLQYLECLPQTASVFDILASVDRGRPVRPGRLAVAAIALSQLERIVACRRVLGETLKKRESALRLTPAQVDARDAGETEDRPRGARREPISAVDANPAALVFE